MATMKVEMSADGTLGWVQGKCGGRVMTLVYDAADGQVLGCGVGPESGCDPNMIYFATKTGEQVSKAIKRWREFFAIVYAKDPEGTTPAFEALAGTSMFDGVLDAMRWIAAHQAARAA